MLKRRIIYLFALLMIFKATIAQVNLQTGSATFSLPMFDWKDGKSRLTATVALSYSSGNGLKVNDVASNVGEGWSIVAGGAINRMQVEEPDDQVAMPGNGTDLDITRAPAGFLYATVPVTNGCPTGLTKYPIYGSINQRYTQRQALAEDKQRDFFSFQFNGKVGMFVLDGNGNGVSLGDNRLKITYQTDVTLNTQSIRTTITSFAIQDIDGLIYKFTVHSLAKVLHEDFTDANLTYPQIQPKFSDGGVYHQAGFDSQLPIPWVINGWYLSEVDDPLTGRKITFTYTAPRNISSSAGTDIMYNNSLDHYVILSHKISIGQTPDIASMVFPDGHTVTFNYGAPRADMTGTFALASVDITYQGRNVSEYQLNTSYFIRSRYGTPITSYQKNQARLCLRSVKKIGVDLKEDSPPYLFDYYLTTTGGADDFIPPPFFYAKDVWGFFNGSNSIGFDNSTIPMTSDVSSLTFNMLKGLCFLNTNITGIVLNPKPKYAQNGLLRQIIYPTGGSLTYTYDQNTGSYDGGATQVNVGGVHVSKTSSADGGFSNGCDNPIVTNYNYVLDAVGSPSSLWGLETPMNSVVMNNHYTPEWKSWHWSGGIFGTCYWHFLYPGILSQLQEIDLSNGQKIMNALAPYLDVLSAITTVMDIATVIGGNTGFLAVAAVVVDIVGGLLSLGISCLHDFSKDTPNTIYYNADLNGASPLPLQYKRVEVVEGSGGMGKTVHEFTSDNDYDIWIPTNPTFSAKQRFAPWAYGLPKIITVKDAGGNMVKQVTNTYSFGDLAHGGCHPGDPSCPFKIKEPLQLPSCKCVVINSSSQRNTDWSDPTKYNLNYQASSSPDMSVDIYDLYSGRLELISTSEKVFKTSDASQYVETVTSFQYDSYNYELFNESTTQSNGDVNTKIISYPSTYVLSGLGTTNPELNKLFNNNILAEPVAVADFVDGSYIHEKATVFTTLPNGDVRAGSILEHRFTQPDVNGHAYWPDNNPYASNYKTIQTFTYDAASNLTGIKDEASRSATNIYDYLDAHIIAVVMNADPVVDKPAYSSFESVGFGGWQLSGTPNYVNSGVTGSRAFVLNGNTFSATNLNTSKAYTLSFWASNSNVVVNGGATLIKSAPSFNGFTYYEFDILQGTANLTVNGNANIDELRLYPKTARMRTATFDPIIGKTSECDENNRITYYEYDNMGRLRFVKDEGKNIVKMYEYNNVSKQGGCPTTYYNRLITETFAKDNCDTAHAGTSVTYTVAANKYSSTINQADADAQAENELLASGQTNADANGSCVLLYFNAIQSQTFTTQSCGEGYTGGSVTYTVPARRYSSLVSQTDANQKALDEISANGQSYANLAAHAVCNFNSDSDWTWDGVTTYCQSVNGQLPPHQFVLETDLNPHSSTYNQTRWSDVGPQDACPANFYYNVTRSTSFTRNNCGAGYVGSSVTYTVPPGIYSSTVSQAAADQLAINDVNANGQNYANTHGSCTLQQTIYAKLTITNTYMGFNGYYYGDVVVSFYSNAACTQPLTVNNLTVNWSQTWDYDNSTSNYSAQVSGSSVTLMYSAVTSAPDPNCDPNFNFCIGYAYGYQLLSGNYVIEY